MGHHNSAFVLRGPFDAERAKEFDLKPITLTDELTLFPLDAHYCDHWTEKLAGLLKPLPQPGSSGDRPIVNDSVVHFMANSIAPNPQFAVIETDYFGGIGSQAAAVYHGEAEVMPPQVSVHGPLEQTIGPINQALRLLGVVVPAPVIFDTGGPITRMLRMFGLGIAVRSLDEFDTVGLDNFRDFDDLFEAYFETSE